MALREVGDHLPQGSAGLETQDVVSELKYASWGVRVLAALIDRLIPLLIVVLGGLVEFGARVSHCISEDPAYSLGP